MKILLIGPLLPRMGGTSVSFRNLVGSLEARDDVSIQAINTFGARGNGVRGLLFLFQLVRELRRGIAWAEVVTLHASTTGLFLLGPIVMYLSRAYKKPFLIRKFGGGDYSSMKSWRQRLTDMAVRNATCFLVQTQLLVHETRSRGIANVRWYSNSRPMSALETPFREKAVCRRFVFIGDVRKEKGIDVLLDAVEQIDQADITVDVYGPLHADIDEKALKMAEKVHYRGFLDPSDVPGTLLHYDVLLLPTYYVGEGYPGVILEGFAAGLPVIATRFLAIPEIIDDSAGILVAPRDTAALRDAMLAVHNDPARFNEMRRAVLKRRNDFSHEKWRDKFIEYCIEAASIWEKNRNQGDH